MNRLGFTQPRMGYCIKTGMWWTSWKGLDKASKEFTHEYVVMQTTPILEVQENTGKEWRERG